MDSLIRTIIGYAVDSIGLIISEGPPQEIKSRVGISDMCDVQGGEEPATTNVNFDMMETLPNVNA